MSGPDLLDQVRCFFVCLAMFVPCPSASILYLGQEDSARSRNSWPAPHPPHRRAPDIERGHVDVIEDGVEQGGAAAAAAGAVMEASRCGVSSGSDGRVVSSIGVG